ETDLLGDPQHQLRQICAPALEHSLRAAAFHCCTHMEVRATCANWITSRPLAVRRRLASGRAVVDNREATLGAVAMQLCFRLGRIAAHVAPQIARSCSAG